MSEVVGGPAVVAGRRQRLAGIAASAALVACAVVLAIVGSGGGSDASQLGGVPHAVTREDLVEFGDSLGHAIYWAGERPGDEIELKAEVEGSVYLRYLPPGVEVGDPRVEFLTVGTYPVADAVGALRRTAARSGASLGHLPGGDVFLANPASRGSVYFARPGSDLQVEVYDPVPSRAMELIRSGAIGPVE